jgi:hypothetical protein
LPQDARFEAAHEIWRKFLEASSEYEVTVEANGRTAMSEYLKALKEGKQKKKKKKEFCVTRFGLQGIRLTTSCLKR